MPGLLVNHGREALLQATIAWAALVQARNADLGFKPAPTKKTVFILLGIGLAYPTSQDKK